MPTEKNITINRVEYITEPDLKNKTFKFTVTNPEKVQKPESLYKYYSLNKLSLDAILNHYLFSPHPFYLNDKYDCSEELIDYSNLTIEQFSDRLAKEMKLFSEEKIRELYDNEKKWVLERAFADINSIILFMKFGIISLAEDPKNILMWAYYSQNAGFSIKLNTSLLPKDFFGPFPINYCEKLEKIDFARYDSSLCVLYQSNAKQDLWKPENEWRYLTYNKDGKYHPLYSGSEIKTRKYYYDFNAIEEVILGYNFFDPKEILFSKRTKEYDIVNFSNRKSKELKKFKRRLLSFIVRNSIPCKQIVRNRYEFLLDPVQVQIEQLSGNKFKIYNSFKLIDD